ncbi:CAF17-like 4Fe-4S cluster assembly/insertion protein YgfZ [Aurantiacibacter sediminis]|uniref:Folate-binding protein n=1 Tax=Aurantiacibacter sediminis TaxID=2793064 RepID=A0ABS0N2B8_9SPHN|nr:folate-binding protein [Aurantiacibacter sediminis]MBH5322099.1 folate-binding protein [Aurantiacibacter sediminis]
MTMGRLTNRAVVRVSPQDESEDAVAFLQGLLTNDVSGDGPTYAALLTAQGKAMFDLIAWRDGTDVLLDCEAERAEDLAKRLSLYRLRRRIDIAVDPSRAVFWADEAADGLSPDPRLPSLGFRRIGEPDGSSEDVDDRYLARRLAHGVAEGFAELGDILWLETNAAELNGVSFTKGCYIGQENTARMNWRQKINRRLVVVPLDMSQEKRRKAEYPALGLAVDHLRVDDIPPEHVPVWMQLDDSAAD